jgi:outer membrane protein TolC
MAVRDVDFEVRADFARIVRAETTLEFRRHAVARLRAYLSQVESRLAAGQGIATEALLAKQRLASARGDTATVILDLDEARLNFNDLLGREPSAPLTLAPLPEPTPPPEYDEEAWRSAPDLQQAGAEVRAAQSELDATRAGRRPHLELEANAGAQPVLGTFDAPLNTGRDWGSEITLWFHLPLWDRGVHAGRMQEADAALQQAKQREIVVRHSADLAWSKALSNLRNLYAELQARDEAVSVARDAYLQAESLYRGGQSRALEVLDAYDAWIQAGQDRLDVIYAYRLAQAELQRWGKP